MLNSVVKISMMSAKYFEYYTIILRGGRLFRGHTVYLGLSKRVSCTETGGPILPFYRSYSVIPRNDLPLGVSLIMMPIYGVIFPKERERQTQDTLNAILCILSEHGPKSRGYRG